MGVGARIMAWLPLPIVMGMFAGSILGYVMKMMSATVSDVAVVGVPVAAYLVARAIKNTKVPPLGLAMIAGAIAIYVTGSICERPSPMGVADHRRSRDRIFRAGHRCNHVANAESWRWASATCRASDFCWRRDTVYPSMSGPSSWTSVRSTHELLLGHPAIIASNGRRDLRGSRRRAAVRPRFGPNLVAASLTIVLAVAAAPVMSLIGVLPALLCGGVRRFLPLRRQLCRMPSRRPSAAHSASRALIALWGSRRRHSRSQASRPRSG